MLRGAIKSLNTIKFLNFWTPENFGVNYLKFKQKGQTLGYIVKKTPNGIEISEDPDQTAPLGLFAPTYGHYGRQEIHEGMVRM